MKAPRWFLHPISIFVLSITALGLSLFLYIYWYVEVSAGLQAVIQKYNLDARQFFKLQTWVVIMVLSILVALILTGIFIIFLYSVTIRRLYRMQYNFIQNFTHELKTPVTSLKLYLETFAKHELPRDERLRYIDYMLTDVERLSVNISRILSLASIEGSTHEAELVTSDLALFIEEFCRKNSHIFRDCRIRVHKPPGGGLYYPIDRALFEMLLMNLLTNAVRYNNSPVPEVDVSFAARKRHLQIRFRDNGIGIEKKKLGKIFKKFYQVEAMENVSPKGSGLGLYLAENIVKLHGGKISAASEGPGKGSVFTVMLPLRAVRERSDE